MTDIVEKKIGLKNRLFEFYLTHKFKLYTFVILVLIFIAVIFYFKLSNEQKNILISEKYVQAGIYLSSNKKIEAKKNLRRNNFRW